MRLRTTSFCAPLIVLALLAGCSSDGDDPKAATGSKRTTTTDRSNPDADAPGASNATTVPVTASGTPSTIKNPDPQPEPNRTKYCGVWGRLVGANNTEYDSDDPAQLRNHYTAVLGVARELEAAAPLEIKGAVQVAIRETQTVVDTGVRDQFNSDESRVNGQRLQDYAAEHCK